MRHVLKTFVFGAIAYLVIRFFVRVASDKTDNGTLDTTLIGHAQGTIAEVVHVLGVVLGIVVNPSKWTTAKDVVLAPVQGDENYADKWGTLVALVEQPDVRATGAEIAQT
jgi:hypothetical protein